MCIRDSCSVGVVQDALIYVFVSEVLLLLCNFKFLIPLFSQLSNVFFSFTCCIFTLFFKFTINLYSLFIKWLLNLRVDSYVLSCVLLDGFNACSKLCFQSITDEFYITSVSYTHLDVYKRQSLYNILFFIVYLLDSGDNFMWLIWRSLFCSFAILFNKYLTLSSVWYVMFNILTSFHLASWVSCVSCGGSVSYTHLDVYKRQVTWFAILYFSLRGISHELVFKICNGQTAIQD